MPRKLERARAVPVRIDDRKLGVTLKKVGGMTEVVVTPRFVGREAKEQSWSRMMDVVRDYPGD